MTRKKDQFNRMIAPNVSRRVLLVELVSSLTLSAGRYPPALLFGGATLGKVSTAGVLDGAAGAVLTVSGPATGLERALSPQVFEVAYSGTLPGNTTIVPDDGAGGRFWPLSYIAAAAIIITPASPTSKFWYAPSSAGAKTISFTNNKGLTNPASHAYIATAQTPGSLTPFRLTRGGSTIGSYATLQQCKDTGAYRSGDVIKCTGGTYVVFDPTDPGAMWLVDNTGGVQIGVDVDTLTIEQEDPNNPMILDLSHSCQVSMWTGGQPQALTMGPSSRILTVRGVHWRGSRPPFGASWFGAAVWTQTITIGAVLTLEYCKVTEFADGFKSQNGHRTLDLFVRYCVFQDNSDNRGLDHDIYSGQHRRIDVIGCTFRKTTYNPYTQSGMGHFLKSRCRITNVHGNLFDGRMTNGLGGVAQTINTPNGGEVSITGNTLLYYGSLSSSGQGEPLRYGNDQHSDNVDMNRDPNLTTHSLLFAQNTVRQVYGKGHVVDGGATYAVIIFPSSVATTLFNGAGTQVPVRATVRNNILSNDTAGGAWFMSKYPNNTTVAGSAISDLGYVTGPTVAGSPAVNDAAFEWAGDFLRPVARADAKRGGRTPKLPSWIPATAWQWTEIPGSTWSNYIKNDGTGVAPAVTAADPGPSKNYEAQWEYSGPCYSAKNHEIWMAGGGHAATTINAFTKYNLQTESPSVSLVSGPTSVQDRREVVFTTAYWSGPLSPFFADGIAWSSHTYTNLVYSDAIDKFVMFPVGQTATSADGTTMSGPSAGGTVEIGSLSRSGVWDPKGTYTNLPSVEENAALLYGVPCLSADGLSIYYWGTGYGMYKFTFSTNTHTLIGGTTTKPARMNAVDGNMSFHVGDSGAGGIWSVKTCSLTTGAQKTVTVSGYTLPAKMTCYGVVWVPSLGKYVAVFLNDTAYNNADTSAANISSILVTTLTLTSSTTATAELKSMTGKAPTKCWSFRGVFYDETYRCVLLAMAPNKPLLAIKII